MLQLQIIRQNPDWVKERLAIKYFTQIDLVDHIIALDNERRMTQVKYEGTQSVINSGSKEIGKLISEGKNEEVKKIKESIAKAKSATIIFNKELTDIENVLYNELVKLPNLPSEKVPKGKTPEDNVVIMKGGNKPNLSKDALPHWELAKKYDLINFELGNKITGSGFLFIKIKEQNWKDH